jgi:Fe-S cluster biogenesis protein NfuA
VINKMLEEVKGVIEKDIRPLLEMEGGSIELEGVDDGVVKVRLTGACAGCPMSQFTLVNFVEATLKDKVPGVKQVVATDDAKARFEELWRR